MRAKHGVTVSALIAAAAAVVPASAQAYPSKPVRIIVPQVSGGPSDIRTRQIAQKLTESFGRPVIVDNRPGGNAVIGARLAARADPDGYTLFNCTNGNALNDVLEPDASADLIRNFVPITRLSNATPILAVNSSLQATSVKEFVELAKLKPKSVSFAHGGKGSFPHLLGEMLRLRAGIEFLDVPYKSSGAQVPDLLGGHVSSTFEFFPAIVPHVRSGKLRALAVTSTKRITGLPDTPTMAEAGYPGVEGQGWSAVCAPAGAPDAVVRTLYQEILKAQKDPVFREQITSLGSEVGGDSPQDFAAYIRAYQQQWRKVVKDAGVTLK
jgi:tripartite-type tricarboxylate transporter receptor subunit TctC